MVERTACWKNQCGSAGMLAIAVMLVFGVLGSSFSVVSSREVTMAANYRDGIAAQYLAEAGARRAIVELSKNPTWKPANPYIEGSGTYRVTVTAGNPTTVEAQGNVNHAARKIVVKVTVGPEIHVVSWNYH